MDDPDTTSQPASDTTVADPFTETRWTMVQSAQAGSAHALEQLLATYRQPIVKHLTRHLGVNDGEDAAQDYLAGLLESEYLKKASREHGKFRAFLLHDLRFFILGWRRKRSAIKRGGKTPKISYEEAVEEGMQIGAGDEDWQVEQFDRDWTLAIMRRVRDDLEEIYRRQGKGDLFAVLEPFIDLGGDAADYEEAGGRLEMTANAVSTAVSRMRARFARMLRDLITQSLAPGESAKEELNYLRECYLAILREGNEPGRG